jgi:hypothetical protein
MEYENKYGSRGVSNAGLTTGIIGTALGVLNGGLGNILGGMPNGYCGCSEDHHVNRYELALQQELAAKNSKISLLESNIYVDSKLADVYERLNNKIGCIEAQICEQRVYNATNTSVLSCLQGQVAQLASLTKIVVPNSSVCPGWTTTTTAAG